jgi:hypothetical protein
MQDVPKKTLRMNRVETGAYKKNMIFVLILGETLQLFCP